MKIALLVDTNFSALPIYESLVQAGYIVFVVGRDPENFLARSLPNYKKVDYDDVESLRRLVAELQPDVVVPGCNDLSYERCAELFDRPLPGFDPPSVTALLHNKLKFRNLCRELALSAPEVIKPEQAVIPFDRTLIVKPADSFSGKGISILEAPTNDLMNSALGLARKESRTGQALVEEFVHGQLYSHSAFIRNGEIRADVFVQEHGSVNPLVVDVSFVDWSLSSKVIDEMRVSARKLVRHLSLVDGLLHIQFISNGTQAWMIEATRRCPGDLYGRLVTESTGINYADAYVAPYLGVDDRPDTFIEKKAFILRHTVTQRGSCGFFATSFKLHSPFDFIPLATSGDKLYPSPRGRVGVLFVDAGDETNLISLAKAAMAGELLELETLGVNP